MYIASLYIYDFSPVIEFSSEKYIGSTGHGYSWYQQRRYIEDAFSALAFEPFSTVAKAPNLEPRSCEFESLYWQLCTLLLSYWLFFPLLPGKNFHWSLLWKKTITLSNFLKWWVYGNQAVAPEDQFYLSNNVCNDFFSVFDWVGPLLDRLHSSNVR